MSDSRIPNLKKKSDKYLFKKKLSIRRKSKGRLLGESIFMLILSILIFYVNYLIPNKILLFKNYFGNLEKTILLTVDILSYLYELLLVVFIVISLILAILLLFGCLYRVLKVIKRKTRKIYINNN